MKPPREVLDDGAYAPARLFLIEGGPPIITRPVPPISLVFCKFVEYNVPVVEGSGTIAMLASLGPLLVISL